jgi:hypothetical protein
MNERIVKQVQVNRNDDPIVVAEKFSEILNEFGIQCVNTNPDSSDICFYKIEVDVEVMEFDPDEHQHDHCNDFHCNDEKCRCN